jgi:hypothetical protein
MVLAQGLTIQSSTAKHTLGQRYMDASTGKEYIYCQDSGSGSSQYCAVTITSAFVTELATKTNVDNGYIVGVPQIAVTADYYYWCLIRGAGSVRTASACATETLLFTTATAGRLDDDPTSQTGVANIYLTATSAATAAASANTACYLEYPKGFAAESTFDVSESMADSSAVLANSAAASAMSAMSSAQSAGSKAESALVLATSMASSAQSSAVSAANIAITASVAQSAYVQRNTANGAATAVSYCVAANTAAGNYISAMISTVSSAAGKTV